MSKIKIISIAFCCALLLSARASADQYESTAFYPTPKAAYSSSNAKMFRLVPQSQMSDNACKEYKDYGIIYFNKDEDAAELCTAVGWKLLGQTALHIVTRGHLLTLWGNDEVNEAAYMRYNSSNQGTSFVNFLAFDMETENAQVMATPILNKVGNASNQTSGVKIDVSQFHDKNLRVDFYTMVVREHFDMNSQMPATSVQVNVTGTNTNNSSNTKTASSGYSLGRTDWAVRPLGFPMGKCFAHTYNNANAATGNFATKRRLFEPVTSAMATELYSFTYSKNGITYIAWLPPGDRMTNNWCTRRGNVVPANTACLNPDLDITDPATQLTTASTSDGRYRLPPQNTGYIISKTSARSTADKSSLPDYTCFNRRGLFMTDVYSLNDLAGGGTKQLKYFQYLPKMYRNSGTAFGNFSITFSVE